SRRRVRGGSPPTLATHATGPPPCEVRRPAGPAPNHRGADAPETGLARPEGRNTATGGRRGRRRRLRTTEMEPTREEIPQEMWKWRALFAPPEGSEREWRAWLGAAQ